MCSLIVHFGKFDGDLGGLILHQLVQLLLLPHQHGIVKAIFFVLTSFFLSTGMLSRGLLFLLSSPRSSSEGWATDVNVALALEFAFALAFTFAFAAALAFPPNDGGSMGPPSVGGSTALALAVAVAVAAPTLGSEGALSVLSFFFFFWRGAASDGGKSRGSTTDTDTCHKTSGEPKTTQTTLPPPCLPFCHETRSQSPSTLEPRPGRQTKSENYKARNHKFCIIASTIRTMSSEKHIVMQAQLALAKVTAKSKCQPARCFSHLNNKSSYCTLLFFLFAFVCAP